MENIETQCIDIVDDIIKILHNAPTEDERRLTMLDITDYRETMQKLDSIKSLLNVSQKYTSKQQK